MFNAFLGFALLCLSSAQAQSADTDAREVEATVRSFHEALRSGNVGAIRQLLAPDAVVLEGGQLESRDEYLSHHLAADLEFAKTAPSQIQRMETSISGATAWVRSTSVSSGTFRDKPIRLAGAELMVLTRKGAGWEIRAIHWSSRPTR
ncbi:MAG TPA: nuclear transport factor 2 family protein [Burkholderiales bacterium]|nr:nuclear transport factor 2 family protein [Burkholderiales bacterium]